VYLHHFDHLDSARLDRLFEITPAPLSSENLTGSLGYGLGATLYMPADRPRLAEDVVRMRGLGVQSVVIDLEDALPPALVREGVRHVVAALRTLKSWSLPRPLLFVRLPDPEAMVDLAAAAGPDGSVLAGFVFAKFDGATNGESYFRALSAAEELIGVRMRAMPIIESASVAYRETRPAALSASRQVIDAHADAVVCVRIGATDLSSVFGLRRDAESTIYDVRVVSDAISDIVNVFGRETPWPYPVAGPVWEHFSHNARIQKPRLRETPFDDGVGSRYRQALLSKGFDGLISECVLDKLNGLSGKSVIHPSHVSVVHALSIVTHEEYCDAIAIVAARGTGGVVRSEYRNKMNVVRPHTAWADRILDRAGVFGVLRPQVSFADVMMANDRVARP
jgi:citrate lyase beta subunit